MKTDKYCHPGNDVEIEYYFYKAKVHSNVLVVSFPAPGGNMQGGAWGYMLTLRKFGDVNILFPMSNIEYSKSRLTYRNGKPELEDAVMGLVQQCVQEANCDYIVALGSSMGGWCSLYYGLKYNWNVIAGSPAYTFYRNKKCALYAFGSESEENVRRMDSLLLKEIKKAGELGYKNKIYIAYGEGEGLWKDVAHGPSMFKALRDAGIEFSYDLYPFSDHNTIGQIFPQILSVYLKWILNKEPYPKDAKQNIVMSAKNKLLCGIEATFQDIVSSMKKTTKEAPFLDIKSCVNWVKYDKWKALRNYVYIKEGWYWGEGTSYKIPLKMTSDDSFWDIERLIGDVKAESFYFQTQLLNYSENENSKEVFSWLIDNVNMYFSKVQENKYNMYEKMPVWVHMMRAVFFIRFHIICSEKGLRSECLNKVPNEVKKCLEYIGMTWKNSSIGHVWEYRMVYTLLYIAMYFYNDKEIYYILVSSALEIEKLYNEYYFDNNGICVGSQLHFCDYIASVILEINNFIAENKIEDKKCRKIERQCNEILNYVSHISRPDNKLAAIGHTPEMQRKTYKDIKRLVGNFIKCKSNIAFLDDGLSYITLNGGSNIHAKVKHCDVLSFTWNYNNKQIFYDAGGGKGTCEVFASSAVAHNAFICDDYDYITPDYEDWTCMDEASEADEFVMISMSHRLIGGVEMKRYFMWIKPNIIIIVDEGISNEQHKYTQNFILGDFKLIKDENHVRVNVSKDDYVDIVQHLNEPCEVEEYRGTVDPAEDNIEKLRGSLIQSWKKPYHGLNLAYTKATNMARFVTSIECHSSKTNGQEYHVSSVQKNKEGDYEICLKENEKKYVICVGDTGL